MQNILAVFPLRSLLGIDFPLTYWKAKPDANSTSKKFLSMAGQLPRHTGKKKTNSSCVWMSFCVGERRLCHFWSVSMSSKRRNPTGSSYRSSMVCSG